MARIGTKKIQKKHKLSLQFSVDCEARRSFRDPSEVLWRDMERGVLRQDVGYAGRSSGRVGTSGEE
jgi:hypothetical protein